MGFIRDLSGYHGKNEKKFKMLVRVGILLYRIISGEGLPLKTLLCHPWFARRYALPCCQGLALDTKCPALGKGKVPLGNVPSRYMRKFLPILSFQQNIGAFHCTINVKAFIHSMSVKFHIELKHI
jgi:hypothetical protein